MWGSSLTIENPFGLSVFGSTLMKTSPDLVSIQAAVARTEQKPTTAVSNVRKVAHEVKDFLRRPNVERIWYVPAGNRGWGSSDGGFQPTYTKKANVVSARRNAGGQGWTGVEDLKNLNKWANGES
jgi:hypothetical protein